MPAELTAPHSRRPRRPPLAVITPGPGSAAGWPSKQADLAALSTNNVHGTVAGSTTAPFVLVAAAAVTGSPWLLVAGLAGMPDALGRARVQQRVRTTGQRSCCLDATATMLALAADRELARADVLPTHRTQRVRPSGASVRRPSRQLIAPEWLPSDARMRREAVLRSSECQIKRRLLLLAEAEQLAPPRSE